MTPETVRAEELLRRMVPLVAAHAGGVVAFDADGTLWSGDVGEDFFFHFLEHAPLLEPAARGISELAAAHGVARGSDARATVDAIWRAYRADAFPEDVVCELVTWCAAGRTRDEVEALARAAVAPELVSRLRSELTPVLEWVRGADVEPWVVSASPRFVVEAALAAVGARVPVPRERVVAVEPRWEGDVMVADVHRPISYAEGKVACLRERIGARPLVAAFGDSGFDAAMLSFAKLGVAIHPKPALLEAQVPGLLVLGDLGSVGHGPGPDFR